MLGMRTIDRETLRGIVISHRILRSSRWYVFLVKWPSHELLAMLKMNTVTAEQKYSYSSLYRFPDGTMPRMNNKQKRSRWWLGSRTTMWKNYKQKQGLEMQAM